MEETLQIVDLSNKRLKKLAKPSPEESQATTLILDDNELQRLDCMDSYQKLRKLSAVRNQLLRMYGICRLHLLQSLNLAQNGVLSIEGLKDLVNLKHLNLSGNNIKNIEHLNTNINLQHLDLSENSISYIPDLSFLKNLEELFLHNNKISHLRQCDRFLPPSLTILTLANNKIEDLNQISLLSHLSNLNTFSFANNPCVSFSGDGVGFDYRPFIINWCMNVRIIDSYTVDAIESLRAEWLYSQGRGRHFRLGDQQELAQYLASVCPLTAKTLETEENRKLRLILSKAKHHQQQLRDQNSESETPIPSPLSRKKLQGSISSENNLTTPSRTAVDRMISSCYITKTTKENNAVMSQSLDPTMLSKSLCSKFTNTSRKFSNGELIEKCLEDTEPVNSPLQALSKLVPVPESLMSPDFRPSPIGGHRVHTPSTIPTPIGTKSKVSQTSRSPTPNHQRTPQKPRKQPTEPNAPTPTPQRKHIERSSVSSKKTTTQSSILRKSVSSEDESEICDAKLQGIQMKVEKSRQRGTDNESDNDKAENAAALCIQRMWRGYYVRNKDARVQEIFRNIQSQRADQYIQKLAADMESTKAALESERKIQMLQMQAINALWKKVSNIRPEAGDGPHAASISNLSENSEVVKDLAQTCTLLQNQIQQLQGSMQDIIKFMNVFSQTTPVLKHFPENGTATQTEISAVHTPQGESARLFPFQNVSRPSSLPLPVNLRCAKKEEKQPAPQSNPELRQFAGSLVDGVIKTVSETRADCFGSDLTEITVTDCAEAVEECNS